jgi:hypothetical protein
MIKGLPILLELVAAGLIQVAVHKQPVGTASCQFDFFVSLPQPGPSEDLHVIIVEQPPHDVVVECSLGIDVNLLIGDLGRIGRRAAEMPGLGRLSEPAAQKG